MFSITGRGTVATGRVERGKVKMGDKVERVGIKETKQTVVTGVEMFRKLLDQAQAGDNVGLLLRGMGKEEIERGMVIVAPGSITPHTKFKAEVYVLTKDEGGRHKPFFTGYRPQFYFRTTDVTGNIKLPEDREMVMPGDNVTTEVELITPIAMEQGLTFAVREGGRTVGQGVVGEIIAVDKDGETLSGQRDNHASVQCLQAAQLYDEEEQAGAPGQGRVQEVLPVLQQAYSA